MTRIKICGITRIDDALEACTAGTDAIGLNFSNASPRYIDPDTAREIVARLPPFVTPVGVFVEQLPEEINDLCRYCGLQVAQLHHERYGVAQALEIRPARVIRVFRPGPGFTMDSVREFAAASRCQGFLFDAYSPVLDGGTGETIAAATAAAIFEETRTFAPAILAGGLRPDNVAEAIRQVRPWGVDTASGVESAPGIKDRERMLAFVNAVRRTDSGLSCGS